MPQRKQKPAQPVAMQPKAPEPTKPEPLETPDWVNETPDETTYSMTMWNTEQSAEQEFYMNRGEFVRLKRWLAALRGYTLLRSPVDSFTADQLRGQSEDERKAAALEITQEEIQMVRDVEYIADQLCVNLQVRLRLGAKVEPGTWELDDDSSEIESSYSRTCGGSRNGLTINRMEAKTSAAGASN